MPIFPVLGALSTSIEFPRSLAPAIIASIDFFLSFPFFVLHLMGKGGHRRLRRSPDGISDDSTFYREKSRLLNSPCSCSAYQGTDESCVSWFDFERREARRPTTIESLIYIFALNLDQMELRETSYRLV